MGKLFSSREGGARAVAAVFNEESDFAGRNGAES
jgi:hypothetical protein